MKPFIIVLTVVFILSLAYGGYESFRTSRANKKAQEAMLLNKDYIQKIDIERAKQEVSRAYAETVDKDIVDIIAFNDVIDKKLTLDLAKSLKVKVPSSEVNAQYEELESSMGDKEMEKGEEAFKLALIKARKEMQIKDLAPEYENLVEKVSYEEDGFKVTNLDLAKIIATFMINQKATKEQAEELAKNMIAKQIKVAKMAKEKGVKVNEELDLMSQLQDYAIGLSEKVREEIKPTDAELESFFNTNKSRYNIPETADAKLIFITVKSTKEDDAVAKAEAEKLLAELTPENFSEKGKTLGNNQDIIYQDLGTFGTKAMVKEFEEALKDVPSNTVINKVIKTKFGYHLVYVKKNDNNQQWSAEHILIVPYPSDKTVAGKLEKLEKLKADIEAGTLALNDKIDEDVIQSFDAKGITPDGIIPDFVYSPEIAKAVFETPLNKVGIINPNKATIIVFQKTKEVKAEEANFTKLKEEVRKDYINKQVGEYMSKLF